MRKKKCLECNGLYSQNDPPVTNKSNAIKISVDLISFEGSVLIRSYSLLLEDRGKEGSGESFLGHKE